MDSGDTGSVISVVKVNFIQVFERYPEEDLNARMLSPKPKNIQRLCR